ncbi:MULTISPECIES: Ig-like domain-containing protein [unclassified Dietzia]|uniref:L,D-transpeptidase n=1 Tax=unclassified Dietzia TaxID=2617939 RepID=UPI0013192B1F|nr:MULTISPECIES: Ig-like domain-containing protein [unclassified Dietzia]MBB1022927.1 L,D-transpeptidase family protein [Dietzia sp. DQ12-76]MBB1027804.1 L,D-transpeptidase family protein [Dietzia sp. DQ11-38-2]QGW24101.1 lipoprotein LppS [Dietzia sp. DQ12-45-1b]
MNVRHTDRTRRRARARSRSRIALAAVFAGSLVLTGCTIGSGGADDGQVAEAPAEPSAVIDVSVEDGSLDANPAEPVVLTARDGRFDSVVMRNPEGVQVQGEFNPDLTEWRTTEDLGYSREYTLESTATDDAGLVTRSTVTFSTVTPRVLTAAYLTTGQGATVGIGQPVAVMFDEPIADRRAAQDNIHIRTEPEVEGAFYWVSNQEVRWRPAEYWAPGTTIDVDVDIYGKDLGGGMYGQENVRSDFQIGDAVISRVDDSTKQIVVERNGEVIKTMPTSMGKADTPTPNGTYVIGEKLASMVMDSSTYGVPVDSPDGYRTPVQYATRMSYSGIFVHAAPWSVWAQGSQNVSHGCLNVTTADAKWFYDNAKRGDIFEVSGTVGPTLPGWDGLGDWNIPWETWKAGNADAGTA